MYSYVIINNKPAKLAYVARYIARGIARPNLMVGHTIE